VSITRIDAVDKNKKISELTLAEFRGHEFQDALQAYRRLFDVKSTMYRGKTSRATATHFILVVWNFHW
jgi:hypothetical protein